MEWRLMKLNECIVESYVGVKAPEMPSFKTATKAKTFLINSFNKHEFNAVEESGKPLVVFNYYEMPDREIIKYVKWVNKNKCKSMPKVELKDYLLVKRMALLTLKIEKLKKKLEKLNA